LMKLRSLLKGKRLTEAFAEHVAGTSCFRDPAVERFRAFARSLRNSASSMWISSTPPLDKFSNWRRLIGSSADPACRPQEGIGRDRAVSEVLICWSNLGCEGTWRAGWEYPKLHQRLVGTTKRVSARRYLRLLRLTISLSFRHS
jgi:hypothetical protein